MTSRRCTTQENSGGRWGRFFLFDFKEIINSPMLQLRIAVIVKETFKASLVVCLLKNSKSSFQLKTKE